MANARPRLGRVLSLSLVAFVAPSIVACAKDAARSAAAASVESAAPATPAVAATPAVPANAPRRVVFLGDSLTAGFGLPASAAYPARVQAAFAREGLPFVAVNAGVSGDTSAGGLRRLDWIFRAPVDVLFVCLGANDGLRGQPVAAMTANLRAIVETGRKRGAFVVLAGMRLPRNYGAEYRAAFAESFAALAKELGAPFLPFLLEGVAGDPALNQADGIHPTAEGAERVGRNVFAFLAPLLRARLAGSPAR